jgi:hypothetical protein
MKPKLNLTWYLEFQPQLLNLFPTVLSFEPAQFVLGLKLALKLSYTVFFGVNFVM